MVTLEKFMNILRLKETGYSISSISRITGRDRKTIRKVFEYGQKPETDSKIPPSERIDN